MIIYLVIIIFEFLIILGLAGRLHEVSRNDETDELGFELGAEDLFESGIDDGLDEKMFY